jgi:putative NADPH-quinone reductase
MKGWMERVLRPGVAYDWQGEEFEEKHHVQLLTSLGLRVMVTTDRKEDELSEAIRLFWSDACSYSGMTNHGVRFYPDMRHSTHRRRRGWIIETKEEIAELCRAT